jgi:hypothetical protein
MALVRQDDSLPLPQGIQFPQRTKKRKCHHARTDEGRKRVLGIIAGILVARHLKTTDDLFETRSSPRAEAMVASTVQLGGADHA